MLRYLTILFALFLLTGPSLGQEPDREAKADPRVDWLKKHAVAPRSIDPADEDFADLDFAAEGFDPASLITVVEALADLTEGLPIDPAAGEVLL